MSVNIQTANGLKRISGDNLTSTKVISALGYTPANEEDLKNYATLVDLSGYLPKEDDGDSFSIADPSGNIIFQVDQNGVNSVDYLINGKSILTTIQESVFSGDYNDLINKPIESTGEDTDFAISDKNGNLIIKIDAAGVNAAAYMIKGVNLYDIFTDENYVDQSVDDLRSEVEQNYTTYDYVDNAVSNAVGGISLNASNISYEDNVGYGTDNVQDTLDLIFGHNHDSVYLKITDAASTYATKTSLNDYLTIVDAEATYLPQIDEGDSFTITDEAGNIAFQVDQNGVNAAAYFVKGVNIADTYLSKNDAASTYLTDECFGTEQDIDSKITDLVPTCEAVNLWVTSNGYVTKSYLNDYALKTAAVGSFEVNGTTITYKDIDGTVLGTFETQDTTYSEATGTTLGLVMLDASAQGIDSAQEGGTYVPTSYAVQEYVLDMLSVYATVASLDDYLLKTDAESTYLSKTDAASTYATIEHVANSVFSGDYNDLTNKPIENEGEDKSLVITDEPGNIIFTVDQNGVNSVDYFVKGVNISDIYLSKDDAYVLPEASATALGGVKIGYEDNGKAYGIKLDTNGKMYVYVPWTEYVLPEATSNDIGGVKMDTTGQCLDAERGVGIVPDGASVATYIADNAYTLPEATSDALGGVKIGYEDNGKAYGIKLDTNGKMYVYVPWVEYTLPQASNTELGGVKLDTTTQGFDEPKSGSLLVPTTYAVYTYLNEQGYISSSYTYSKTEIDNKIANAYTLPQATADALGGVKIGYEDNGKAYGVKLDTNGKMYVHVPWTEYTLPEATTNILGGVKMDTTGQCLEQADAKIVPDAASIVYYIEQQGFLPKEDEGDNFTLTDKTGNIIFTVDKNGVNSVDYLIKGESIINIINAKIAEAATGEVDLSAYLTVEEASSTYATKAALTNYATQSYVSTGYATKDSISDMLTKTDAAATYFTISDWQSNSSALQQNIAGTYATISSLSDYLKSTDASSTYLKKTDAASTYLKIADKYVLPEATANTLGGVMIDTTAQGIDGAQELDTSVPTVYAVQQYFSTNRDAALATVAANYAAKDHTHDEYLTEDWLGDEQDIDQSKTDLLPTCAAVNEWVTGKGYITSSALSPYLKSTDAASTYALATHDHDSVYLKKTDAASTYATAATVSGLQNDVSNIEQAIDQINEAGYITSSALSPYLKSTDASSTYATKSLVQDLDEKCADTYLPLSGGDLTGTVSIDQNEGIECDKGSGNGFFNANGYPGISTDDRSIYISGGQFNTEQGYWVYFPLGPCTLASTDDTSYQHDIYIMPAASPLGGVYVYLTLNVKGKSTTFANVSEVAAELYARGNVSQYYAVQATGRYGSSSSNFTGIVVGVFATSATNLTIMTLNPTNGAITLNSNDASAFTSMRDLVN